MYRNDLIRWLIEFMTAAAAGSLVFTINQKFEKTTTITLKKASYLFLITFIGTVFLGGAVCEYLGLTGRVQIGVSLLVGSSTYMLLSILVQIMRTIHDLAPEIVKKVLSFLTSKYDK